MMEEYQFNSMKLKRKDLEEVSDDFSDFSLSSPARKIRRLDAELPPITEDEELEIPIIEQPEPDQGFVGNVPAAVGAGGGGRRGVVIEELPSEPENVERAIVPFKPNDSPLLLSPSNFTVTVDPQFISDIKYQVLWPNRSNLLRRADDEVIEKEKNSGVTNDCMAVVPWLPSQPPLAARAEVPSQTELCDMMDAEEMETVAMEVEDNNIGFEPTPASEAGGTNFNEGVHQWQQQQHCMFPQPPENTATPTPVVWYQ